MPSENKVPGFYARTKDPELKKYVYQLMVDTGWSMREILEEMVRFCKKSKSFTLSKKELPQRITKAQDAHERKKEKLKKVLADL